MSCQAINVSHPNHPALKKKLVVDSKGSAVTLQEAAALGEGRRLPVAVKSLLLC